MTTEWVSAAGAGEIFGVTHQTWRNWVDDQVIPITFRHTLAEGQEGQRVRVRTNEWGNLEYALDDVAAMWAAQEAVVDRIKRVVSVSDREPDVDIEALLRRKP